MNIKDKSGCEYTTAFTKFNCYKRTTNPNVSPIGKRFGFECFGAADGT